MTIKTGCCGIRNARGVRHSSRYTSKHVKQGGNNNDVKRLTAGHSYRSCSVRWRTAAEAAVTPPTRRNPYR